VFLLIVVVIGMSAGCRWRGWCGRSFFRCAKQSSSEAARALGASLPRQVVRHILPIRSGGDRCRHDRRCRGDHRRSTLSFLGLVSRPTFQLGRIPRLQGLSRHRAPFRAVSPELRSPRVLTINFIGDWPARPHSIRAR